MARQADGLSTAVGTGDQGLASIEPQQHRHRLHYRFSTSLFGRRFYMAVVAGSEHRSARRLRDDGGVRAFWAIAAELSVICMAATLTICLLTGFAVIALYLVKCAMGLDLLDGPSPLHPIFEYLRGR